MQLLGEIWGQGHGGCSREARGHCMARATACPTVPKHPLGTSHHNLQPLGTPEQIHLWEWGWRSCFVAGVLPPPPPHPSLLLIPIDLLLKSMQTIPSPALTGRRDEAV